MAVSKILYAKFQLGLFEKRQVDVAEASEAVLRPGHRDAALEAARKSLVLLKNQGKALPLAGVGSVLVTGPNANDQSLLGDWSRQQPDDNVTTIVEGLKAAAPAGVSVRHVATGPIAGITDQEIHAAVEAANQMDAVVLAVGENSLRDNPDRTSGENVDRASLEPQGRQLELMRALVATGKPVIVVLVNGAPMASEWMVDHAAAILEAWEPGMLGGQAIGEAIFGAINPSGRLPMTVPRSVGQLRSFYNHRPSAYHRGKFRFTTTEPLFPFGYGLSYTTFSYGNLQAPVEIAAGEPVQLQVDVVNTGERAGDEIVLLFVQDLYASVTRPVKELQAFQRVTLEAGERRTVRFELPAEAFSMLDASLARVTEPGEFRLMVGLGGPEHTLRLR